MTLATDEKRDLLGSVELFAALDPEALARVSDVAGEIEFSAGQVIARQGHVETGFYLIISGRTQVVRGGRAIAELGPGQFFGELSVLDQQPRLASVVAVEPTRCLALASWDLLRLLESTPSVGIGLLRELARRLRTLTESHLH